MVKDLRTLNQELLELYGKKEGLFKEFGKQMHLNFKIEQYSPSLLKQEYEEMDNELIKLMRKIEVLKRQVRAYEQDKK